MSANGHARRLDRIEAELPPIRPSAEVLEEEYDRLIGLYKDRNAGEEAVVITPKWPFEAMDVWMRQIIEELIEEGTE